MQNVNITQISNGHISVLLEARVTWSGMLVLGNTACIVDADMTLTSTLTYLLHHFGVELKTDG